VTLSVYSILAILLYLDLREIRRLTLKKRELSLTWGSQMTEPGGCYFISVMTLTSRWII
jgi:hypothetical protein